MPKEEEWIKMKLDEVSMGTKIFASLVEANKNLGMACNLYSKALHKARKHLNCEECEEIKRLINEGDDYLFKGKK